MNRIMAVKSENNYETLMTCEEVAEFLRVHVSSVRRWSRNRKLRAYKVGDRGDWRFRRQDVLFFLDKNSELEETDTSN